MNLINGDVLDAHSTPDDSVQALVQTADNWIVAYGQFPSGTSDPDLYVVIIPPDQVAMLEQPGQKVWNPDSNTITIADLGTPIVDYTQRERDETERTIVTAETDSQRLDALTKLTLSGR
jgi:hypothetical protein